MVFAIGWIVGRFLITPKGQGSSYTSIKQDAHGSSKIVVILNVQILLTAKPEEPAEAMSVGNSRIVNIKGTRPAHGK